MVAKLERVALREAFTAKLFSAPTGSGVGFGVSNLFARRIAARSALDVRLIRKLRNACQSATGQLSNECLSVGGRFGCLSTC